MASPLLPVPWSRAAPLTTILHQKLLTQLTPHESSHELPITPRGKRRVTRCASTMFLEVEEVDRLDSSLSLAAAVPIGAWLSHFAYDELRRYMSEGCSMTGECSKGSLAMLRLLRRSCNMPPVYY